MTDSPTITHRASCFLFVCIFFGMMIRERGNLLRSYDFTHHLFALRVRER